MRAERRDGIIRANAFGRFVLAQSDQLDPVDDSGNLVVLRKWLNMRGGTLLRRGDNISYIAYVHLENARGVFQNPLVSNGEF